MFKLTIDTNNAAFDDHLMGACEVARILRQIADDVEQGETEGFACDINGNRVAKFELT